MATIVTANIDFESTGNNQIVYTANTVTIRTGGATAAVINNSVITYSLPIFTPTAVINAVSNSTIANTFSITSNGGITVAGQINLNGVITPTAINVNTAAFSPPVLNETVVRLSANSSNNSALSIYGMTAGTNGQVIILSNIGTKAIRISNEDIANETTAGNRFQLPQEILLNGYQSMTVYYDGIAARWKPTDYYGNFSYKTGLLKGFYMGGTFSPTPNLSTAERVTFSSETNAAVSGANFVTGRGSSGTSGNACKAFFSGGSTPTPVTSTERITYASETNAAVAGANLSQAKQNSIGIGNINKSFLGGGFFPSPISTYSTIERITYSTETNSSVPITLSSAKWNVAGYNAACKGFYAAGSLPSPSILYTTIDRLTYASETNVLVPGAFLTVTRSSPNGTGNFCKGFVGGGSSPTPVLNTPVTNVCRLTYSTETIAAVPGAFLIQAKFIKASGNACKMFNLTGSAATNAERITYATETNAATPGVNNIQTRDNAVASY